MNLHGPKVGKRQKKRKQGIRNRATILYHWGTFFLPNPKVSFDKNRATISYNWETILEERRFEFCVKSGHNFKTRDTILVI